MKWIIVVLGPTQWETFVVGPFDDANAALIACQAFVDLGLDAKVHQTWTAQQAVRWIEVGRE